MKPDGFTVKCFPQGNTNWEFEYPEDRLLPLELEGVITDDLMRAPNMRDLDGEPLANRACWSPRRAVPVSRPPARRE